MTTDLLAATAELVDIPSVSRHESALADHVAAALADRRAVLPLALLGGERAGIVHLSR